MHKRLRRVAIFQAGGYPIFLDGCPEDKRACRCADLRSTPLPPIILYEYQKKGITKGAFRKSLILKDAIWLFGVVFKIKDRLGSTEKEKLQKPAAVHALSQLYLS